jgi:hypothetical protein
MAVSSSFRVRLMSKLLIWSVRQPPPSVCLLPNRSDDLAVGSNIDLAPDSCHSACDVSANRTFSHGSLPTFKVIINAFNIHMRAQTHPSHKHRPLSLSVPLPSQPQTDSAAQTLTSPSPITLKRQQNHPIPSPPNPHHTRTSQAQSRPHGQAQAGPHRRPLTGRPIALLSAHTTGTPLRPPVAESRVFVSEEETLLWCVSSLAVCREGCVCAGRGSGGGDWLRAW